MSNAPKIRYGLLDTVDKVWIGIDTGPLTYDDQDTAQAAAQIVCVALGWDETRVKGVEYIPPKVLYLRDEVKLSRSPKRAIEIVEGRAETEVKGEGKSESERPLGLAQGVVHGVNCPKAPHDKPDGYLHSETDDSPYDVDCLPYCGRCHMALDNPPPPPRRKRLRM